MMGRIILHPTDMCQWHALVNEAQAVTQLVLNEELESYLVFLLMRFSMSSDWVDSPVALDFLKSMQKKPVHVESLRDVGDKSLLFSGLFPEIALKRNVGLDYYIEMGKAAYLTASEVDSRESAELYYHLSLNFVNLQNILHSIRENDTLPKKI
jgi:hypothetical protein